MAAKTFKLEVVTPDKIVYSDNAVVSVVIPGSEGYFGVLAGHAPLMAEMSIGELDIKHEDNVVDEMFICGGFVEVFQNTVTVLAHTAELGKDIDIDRAEQALQRARDRIASNAADVDHARAQVALQKAMARLSIVRKRGQGL
jgi:F-type H+-transporting ATPase subunit epsilon